MARGNEINAVLTYSLSAVAGVIVVLLAILSIVIVTIRYMHRKQQQRMRGIHR